MSININHRTNEIGTSGAGVTTIPPVATYAALRLMQPASGQKTSVVSGSGGIDGNFYAKTGAAPGTYVDNGGTIIVPTNGDGSAAWLRDYSGAVNVKWFNAKGDGVTDDTAALQHAINITGAVYFPSGVYILNTITASPNGNLENYFLNLPSNVTLYGDGYSSQIKIANGLFSQIGAGFNAHILEGYGVQNVEIYGLTFDMNGANNLTPNGYTRNAMAVRLASGGTNVKIHNNTILDCSGNNMISLNLNGATGKTAKIYNNYLINGGKYVGGATPNTYNTDFSFVYSEWDKTDVFDNHIEQQNITIALTGYSGGIELHGSYSSAHDNTIVGCDPGVWIASAPNAITDIEVVDNHISSSIRGIAFFQVNNTSNVTVANNDISIAYVAGSPTVNGYGIQVPNGGSTPPPSFSAIYANAAPISNVSILGNKITSDSTAIGHAVFGMYLHSLNGGRIAYNSVNGLYYIGMHIDGSPWGMIDVSIEENTILDCGNPSSANAGIQSGIFMQSWGTSTTPSSTFVTKDVFIRNNTFGNTHKETYDNTGAIQTISCTGQMWSGIVVSGLTTSAKVDGLHIEGNKYKNVLFNIYGGTNPQVLEGQNAGAHFIPDVIAYNGTTFDPLWHLFGSEILCYPKTGTVYKLANQGNLNSTTFTSTVSASSNAVVVSSSVGLRVGMFITIAGAGAAGATLYTFITSITDLTNITIYDAASTSVTTAASAIYSPAPTPFRANETTGVATLNSGTTSVVITHGLPSTPVFAETTPQGNVGAWWVTAIGATTFTFNCATAPGTNTSISWKASI